MPGWLPAALVVLTGYLAGSIPFAWIVTKAVKGIDIRTVGSGNVGATNASRVLGRKWFPVVFALDAAKGAAPVLLAPLAGLPPEGTLRVAMAAGLAAILGHLFPVFLGFRGGKGVATGAGVLIALFPAPVLCALAVFGLSLLAFRYVSLSSVAACAALPPLAWAFGVPVEGVVFCAVVAGLVIVRHRKNLSRIAAGTEPRVFAKKSEAAGA